MATQLPRTARAKFPNNKWTFDYHPTSFRWETYRQPLDWPEQLFPWLTETFGYPGPAEKNGNWDYHGGWIYLYREECLTAFMLKWS